ncbi:DUF2029 domain-containing protein [Streptomyces triticagri]|uniref:DUF2029 domain-containing protein n=1 Tax=Streptomyces triticagri TaxID=2293568 RepID=A0A372M119_9ACTN|nr:DUF2029 domain-containing protein [Streptomyces triticagri]
MWAIGWAAAACCAAAVGLLAEPAPHRLWGRTAAIGYLSAALLAHVLPGRCTRTYSSAAALTGAVAVPFLQLALTGRAQSEVGVVERSAALLRTTGSPYLADPATVTDYNPYLPGMSLFGLPAALLGEESAAARLFGDPRLWCALVLVACLAGACAVLRRGAAHRPNKPPTRGSSTPWAALSVLVASPLVALPLCVSGVDLPLVGLCCLGLALAAGDRPYAAGLALAAACALKWTALPAVTVACALLASRSGARAATRCLAAWSAGVLAAVVPFALAAPGPLLDQVVAFPTGRAAVATPADSPLPGRLLADLGPPGWYAAIALLVCGGVAVGVSLVLRPPADAFTAVDRLAAGLCIAFLCAPAGRFGYFVLPLVLVAWVRIATPARRPVPRPEPRHPIARHRADSEESSRLEHHTRRHQRLPAAAGRDRDVRPRHGHALPGR